MGFRLLDDADIPVGERDVDVEEVAPLALEDEVHGVEIEDQVEIQGREIPIGHVVLTCCACARTW